MTVVGVTGGNGFIGSWVCKALDANGYEVVRFDHRGNGEMLGDIRDATAITEFAAHVDGIIHLAAVLGTQETIANPRPAAETNILGGINVLEACRLYRLPLVNICVGNWWMRNTYSTTKHAVERLVEQYRDNLNLPFANVRVVNAYGPGQKAAAPFGSGKVRKIMPSFVCRALTGAPIEIYGDGEQVSDMVHVSDVAHALVRTYEACAAGITPCRVVEVGPSEHHTVNDVAHMVRAAAFDLGYGMSPIEHLPMRPGEEPGAQVIADNSTLSDVGLSAKRFIPLVEGIRGTVSWFADVRGSEWE